LNYFQGEKILDAKELSLAEQDTKHTNGQKLKSDILILK